MNTQFSRIIAACLAGFSLTIHADAPTALRGGMVPGADILVHINNTALNQSPFNEAMKANLPDDQKVEQEKKKKEFEKVTGLDPDRDILAVVISADIDEVDFESEDPAQLLQVPGLAAVQLAKAVDLKKASAGVLSMIPEGDKLTSVETDLGGHPAMVFSNPEKSGKGPEKLFAQMDSANKTLLLGFNAQALIKGRERIETEKRPSPTPELGNAISAIGPNHVRTVVLLPDAVQAKLKASVNEAAAGGGMGAMFAPLGNLTGVFVGVSSTDNLDLNIQLDVGDNAVAQQLNGMVQGMLPMMMMGMSQQLGPKAMTLSQKFKISAEGSALSIRANLTPEDLKPEPGASGGNPLGL